MGTKSHVSRWGASLAVRIPKAVAEQWGVREGSPIEILPGSDEVVLRKKTYDLDTMLADVNPDNLHAELDTGAARGGEEW